jgi:hypothetical protein
MMTVASSMPLSSARCHGPKVLAAVRERFPKGRKGGIVSIRAGILGGP